VYPPDINSCVIGASGSGVNSGANIPPTQNPNSDLNPACVGAGAGADAPPIHGASIDRLPAATVGAIPPLAPPAQNPSIDLYPPATSSTPDHFPSPGERMRLLKQ